VSRLDLFLEKPVLVAVVIEIPSASQLQPSLGVAFGIEFHHLDSIRGYERRKGNKMLLGHGVGDGDKVLVLHFFYGDPVGVVCVFRFQGGQGDTAAADHRTAGAVKRSLAEESLRMGSAGAAIQKPADDLMFCHKKPSCEHRQTCAICSVCA